MHHFLRRLKEDVDHKPYLIALNHIAGIGPRTILKCLESGLSLKDLFHLSQSQLIRAGLTLQMVQSLEQLQWHMVDDDLKWQEMPQHHILTWCDANYPPLLLEIADPPPVIYAIGQIDALLRPSIAIVGTRKPSSTGRETAFAFAKELAKQGITIVSGLALGIDGAAHAGCLDGHGQTIAVLGSGVERIYPRHHQSLAQHICQNGLLCSEFSRQMPPMAGHFPRRNRIISGLTSATLVVEAAVKSGSLITARYAIEQNRDVLAVPGSIHYAQARGCHYLLQQGAKLVTSVADILEELQLNFQPLESDKTNAVLASKNQNLVKCIGFEITTMDQILARSRANIEEVMCGLVELELLGMIKAVSGGYMRCM